MHQSNTGLVLLSYPSPQKFRPCVCKKPLLSKEININLQKIPPNLHVYFLLLVSVTGLPPRVILVNHIDPSAYFQSSILIQISELCFDK